MTTPSVPWELIDNYSQDSTIHGMKYLGGKKQHWMERLFWLSIFVVSITFCAINMKELYDKREEKPVMISVSKRLTPTFDIPFPSVTICPEIKAKCDKINMTKFINHKIPKLSKEEIARVAALSHVCEANVYDENIKSIANESNGIDVVKTLEEMSWTMDEMFEKCRFRSWKFESCQNLFAKTLTDAGICYTFNMLSYKDLINPHTTHSDLHHPKHENHSNWKLEKDYNTDEMNAYPRRVIGAGIESGLSIQLKFNSSMLCPSCMSGISGFRVSLHTPAESSQISRKFYNIPFGRETSLIVKPNMIYSSKDIQSYKPEKRACYFSSERKLKHFRIYTQENCELECKAVYALRKCGCAKFSMPRSNETLVCGNEQLECIHNADMDYDKQELQRVMMQNQLKRDIKHGKATKDDPREKAIKAMETCGCLPSCTSLKYEVEVSQTDFSIAKDGYEMASLNIYFEDAYFSRLKRYEIYGLTDYLSNSGGILGLFMGCSVLSFVEILYHIVKYVIKKYRKFNDWRVSFISMRSTTNGEV